MCSYSHATLLQQAFLVPLNPLRWIPKGAPGSAGGFQHILASPALLGGGIEVGMGKGGSGTHACSSIRPSSDGAPPQGTQTCQEELGTTITARSSFRYPPQQVQQDWTGLLQRCYMTR